MVDHGRGMLPGFLISKYEAKNSARVAQGALRVLYSNAKRKTCA